MNLNFENQRGKFINCSHRWLVSMLSEMSEYAMLNDLQDVKAAIDVAQCSIAVALDVFEEKISQSRNDALFRMLR